MKKRPAALAVIGCVCLVVTTARAEIAPGAGKYNGIIVCDRWGGCGFLSMGSYIYLSPAVQKTLAPLQGKLVQLAVKGFYQLINPGPLRLDAVDGVKELPSGPSSLSISLQLADKKEGAPRIQIQLENRGKTKQELFSSQIQLCLLKKGPRQFIYSPRQRSFALIQPEGISKGGSSGTTDGRHYSWGIGKKHRPRYMFSLHPEEKRRILVRFGLPEGEYAAFVSYGISRVYRSTISNLVYFVVKRSG